MTAYAVIIQEKLRDAEEMKIYGAKATATVAAHKVKPLALYGAHETVEGAAAEAVVVLEFDDMASAKAWYNSPEYTEARMHRHKAADFRVIFVEGV